MKSRLSVGLVLAISAISVAAAPGGNKPPKPPADNVLTPFAYYAADGTPVGLAHEGYVAMRLGNLTFHVPVYAQYEGNETLAAWSAEGGVSFDQTGCTGNACLSYNSYPGNTGIGEVAFGPLAGDITLYVARADSRTAYTEYSFLARDGICYESSGIATFGYPGTATYDLAAMYPLPLTIR